VNAHRLKVLCATFSVLSVTANAQQARNPALGNEGLTKQRIARFLAERGIASSYPNPSRYGRSQAQMLAQARAQYRRQVQQSTSATVPAWQPVGPAQVMTSAYQAVAGRVTSIAVDPSDTTGNTVYVGTASGGVWKSTNAAGNPLYVTFSPLTDTVYASFPAADFAPSLSIGAISLEPPFPGSTPVLLAGTGDPNDTSASYFGSGILRSTDGGNQWSLINRAGGNPALNYRFDGNGFAGFAWGNVSGSPVVVAAASQAQQSVQVNAEGNQLSVLGIYYSTDEGQTWSMATINDPSGQVQSPLTTFPSCGIVGSRTPCGNAVTSVVWNPARKQFYAAVRFHGYYQSSDGQNWTRLTNQPGLNLTTAMCPRQLGYSGSQACPIYNGVLAVQPVTGDTFALTTDINNLDQGLWQDECQFSSGSCASSTLNFTQIPDSALDCSSGAAPGCPSGNAQPTLIPQSDYDLYLAAVPSQQGSQPDTLLFVGTADIYRCDLAAGCLWRNTTHAQSSDCNSAHVAPAQYAIDSTFGATGLLFFGNDGGLWRSTDAVNQQQQQCSADDALHFQNLNPSFTGSIADVEDFALDATNPQTIMVSLGPLGTAAPLAAATPWQQVLNGEGDYAAIDPANPQNWYATSEFGIGVNLCTEGSACGIAGFGSPAIDSADVGDDGYGQVIPAPWILDPQNTSSIILGTCRVWRGPASGAPLNQLSTMLDGDNGPYCNGNAEVRSLAASGKLTDAAGTPERIYAGMAGLYDGGATVAGHIFEQSVTTNITPSPWNDLSYNLNNFNPNGFDISSIYVDPHSPDGQTIYATLQGFGRVQLYQSTDGGSIWQDISGGLPNAPANDVLVDPNDANTVYVATDAGVYYTQNISSCTQVGVGCWNVFGTALPSVPVTQLTAGGTSTGAALFAATYGRGIWQISIDSGAITTGTAAPSSLAFGDEQVGTVTAPQQVLVTNTGSTPLQVSKVSITQDFIESDTCSGQTIAPDDACIVEVRFAPSKVAAETGLLTVYGNLAGGGQLTVSLSGTGSPGASVTLTPTTLCFQATLIGQTASAPCGSASSPGQTAQPGQSMVIANSGGAPATLNSISISGDFAIAANTCGSSLAPANTANDSCTVSITFTPTASGNRVGTLTVTGSAGTQTALLSGTGQTPATDLLAPLSLSFGSQIVGSTSGPQQIVLANNGDQSVQSIAVQSSTADFVAANNCGTTLSGHSSCAILVSFQPSTIGTESGTLVVSDIIASGSSAPTNTQTVSLTGTGVAPPGIVSTSPSAINFGFYAVGKTSPAQTISLINEGTSTVSGIQTTATGDFALQAASTDPCGSTLLASGTCNIGVVFSPTQVNARSGSLTITGSSVPTPLVVALSGSGAGFTMRVSGSSSQVITASETAQPFQLEIDSVNGSTGPVNLTCSVVPSTATCTVPASVTLTGDASQFATVGFSVSQQAIATSANWKEISLALAMLVPVGLFGVRRRKWCALVASAGLMLFLAGCGVASSAGANSSSGGSSTTSGQYTITVIGSMPGLTQTVTMQVTVQ
jgi:hypothetical protein